MKRFLAVLMTVVMLLSMFTCITFAATVSMLVNPTVFVGGDFYNVVWVTNNAGIGYVEYTYEGTKHRVYDEENGVVRTDDTIHTVQVPKEHLDTAGSYTAYTTLVNSRNEYTVSLGNTISVSRSFQGYHGQSEINAWTITDTHGINPSKVKAATAKLPNQNPDIVFMLGDLITFCSYKQVSSNSSSADYWNHSLCYIFRMADALTGGTRPVAYTRGNHETRVGYSTYLKEYIGGETGELYFDFTYGPISSIVLDYGEDKVDTHHEYTGFAHFEDYHNIQNQWLANLGGYPAADTAQYKITLVHGHDIDTRYATDMMAHLADYGTDMMYTGHNHTYDLMVPKGYSLAAKTIDANLTKDYSATQYEETSGHTKNFPILINGSHFEAADKTNQVFASQYTFKNGQIKTYVASSVKSYSTSFTVNAGLNTPVEDKAPLAEQSPAVFKTPDYYSVNDDESDDTTFANITKPVVFDSGENYTVVWASSAGKGAVGQVRVHANGAVYKFADTTSGYSNFVSNTLESVDSAYSVFSSTKNIHSAVVPKKYLEMGKYECVSLHLQKAGYTTNLEVGAEITTGLIDFDGYDKGEDVEMMVVSDWNTADDMVSKLRTSAKTADVLVLGGNIASKMQTPTDFSDMLYSIGQLTNGKKPVYFVRGESEIKGAYAPYLMRVLKFKSNQFFNKVTFGPVTSLIFDTAAPYADSFTGYNGLVSFEATRKAQYDWLANESFGDSEYNLVFSSNSQLYNYCGTDYNKLLNKMGADLAVFSDSKTSAFTANGERGQSYATATNGSFAGDGTIATVLNFKDGNITVKAIKSGATLMTNTVSNAANEAVAFADVESTAWYAEAVSYSAQQSLMVGKSNDTFDPESSVTRAEAAVVLASLANADLENTVATPFADVDKDAYYAKAVAWCYENKVTFGTSETTFSPDATLTREQLCALIVNMFPDKFEATEECDFADYDAVADYAKTAVAALSQNGVIVGMGDGNFMPKADVTRAQLAQILYASQL